METIEKRFENALQETNEHLLETIRFLELLYVSVNPAVYKDTALRLAKKGKAILAKNTHVEPIEPIGITTEFDEDDLEKKAREYGIDFFRFKNNEVFDETLIQFVPRDMVLKYRVMPVKLEKDLLTVAASDPSDFETLDALSYVLRLNIKAVLADKTELDRAIAKFYGDYEA